MERARRTRVVALAASGRQLDEPLVEELAAEPELTVLCGRYEGFDERVHEHLASDVVSIGPYVLSGGEVAAMALCDAVLRKLPGALGHEESATEESFSSALEGAPEYPHYTRPAEWRGHGVPDVLVSGDHGRIGQWRLEQSRARMAQRTRAARSLGFTVAPSGARSPAALSNELSHRQHRAEAAAQAAVLRRR